MQVFLYIKANRRFLAYLGQLTTAFKLSSHLILQTGCKQSVKKGSAEESRAQASQTSNLNPKGRNKIEIKGEHRDHLNSVCCFAHLFFGLCTKLEPEKGGRRGNTKSCAGKPFVAHSTTFHRSPGASNDGPDSGVPSTGIFTSLLEIKASPGVRRAVRLQSSI